MDFSPLCGGGGLSTIFRRFTSLLGVATRLTRIDKTSRSSPVFSILAGPHCHSRVADKRGHWCENQEEMGTFFTNKQTRRYIHSCQGNIPDFIFLSRPMRQQAAKGQQSLSLDLALVAKTLPGKLLKILLKIVKICTCDDEIIVNVTLTENVQPCL